MVGRTIALDLAKKHIVTSFDLQAANLAALQEADPRIRVRTTDLTRYEAYPAMLEPFDLVITAVPGFMGFRVLEAVIEAGKNVVDISFFPEDAMQLAALAGQKQVTVITDCGVAPGMSNFIIGRYNEEMAVKTVACYVGGLPVVRKKPFEYKAPFSPVDVIQEYIRPARLVEGGQVVTKPALSDAELLYFEGVGELEAFNTDGLRSLVHTMSHIADMKEKTLRYPGHISLILALQQAGFFDTTPVMVAGSAVVPLEFTTSLLLNEWQLLPGEEELTVMKVILEGEDRIVEYHLLDRYDPASRTSSMARTTGYTCTAAAELLLQQLFTKKGVFPPELVGSDPACFSFVLNYLKERGVHWKKEVKTR